MTHYFLTPRICQNIGKWLELERSQSFFFFVKGWSKVIWPWARIIPHDLNGTLQLSQAKKRFKRLLLKRIDEGFGGYQSFAEMPEFYGLLLSPL